VLIIISKNLQYDKKVVFVDTNNQRRENKYFVRVSKEYLKGADLDSKPSVM
jgi:hypothetical protein